MAVAPRLQSGVHLRTLATMYPHRFPPFLPLPLGRFASLVPSLAASLVASSVALVVASVCLRGTLHAQASPKSASPDSATYSDEQADRGEKVFARVCVQCHTKKDLSSADFRFSWGGRTAFDLFDRVRTSMPDDAPGSLSQESYLDVTAYMMKLNGMRAGVAPAPVDSVLRRIKLELQETTPPSLSKSFARGPR